MINIDRALRSSIRTGKVVLGSNLTLEAGVSGRAKLVISAIDCPEEVASGLKKVDVPVYNYSGRGKDLGSACGKPFSVAALAVIEPGDSEIMALLREIRGIEDE
ncbi:MAG: 50S ribosomal protein L30e [Methanothrix sp.]|jgi:Ribosomal protein L30E|uniref:Large ribosomal subunit protein eL30 n=1 Tax=Methanothrix harundinacea TaxID=301375 RepID=A0A101FVI6_9EURY|nr:MAG: 50S ribosomal protein L30e [Methanothrix harundinacea]MDD2637428.1 50S ribosomal protein L30e [Methanothrix sp.]MDI9399562.1 50S ribosomal protein L30e [Euryarchaeota archaeon]KUK96902.1 MAG: 50S ribosomal protein L30e [Methanothrix harundinacea]MCP1392890.1 50S ribosomal protein L30e [Methanothrix harundinacea]